MCLVDIIMYEHIGIILTIIILKFSNYSSAVYIVCCADYSFEICQFQSMAGTLVKDDR